MDPLYPLVFLHWAVCSTGMAASLTLGLLVVIHAPRRRRPLSSHPALTIIKPFDGTEPRLEDNFWSYVAIDYPGARQVLFCTDRGNAEGIAVVEGIRHRLAASSVTGVEIDLLLSEEGEEAPPNRKVWHLERGLRRARHDVVVCGDSGTLLDRRALDALLAPLLEDPGCGVVWASYTGDGRGGVGGRLTQLTFSGSTLSFYVLDAMARFLRLPPFVAGGLFAMHRGVLQEMGGFAPLANFIAEDMELGRRLAQAGRPVVVSAEPVMQYAGHTSVGGYFGRLRRWTVIMWRRRDPLRIHFPMVLCTTTLAALTLPLAVAAAPERAVELVLAFAALVVVRELYALLLLVGINRRRWTFDVLWGVPLMELLLLLAYVVSFFSRTVRWRDREITVHDGGTLAD